MDEAKPMSDLHLLLSAPQQLPSYTQYESLDVVKKEIRLLSIWKSDRESRVHARLDNVSLLDAPAYEALSYYWGAPSAQKVLIVNNKEVLIRESLYSFLKTLAINGQSLPVWLDMLCINQKDVAERNQQVSMMSDIYRSAKRVLSWIGEPNADSEYAFAFAQHNKNPELLRSDHYSNAKSRARECWLQILSRPYWRRVWIVQEVCLGKNLRLLCGPRVIEWSDFMAMTRDLLELSEYHDKSELIFDEIALAKCNPADRFSIANIFHLESARSAQCEAHNASNKSLAEIVIDFEGFQCSEQKDHVYGFTSLAAQPFPVDYSKSFAEIFIDLIRHSKFMGTQNAPGHLHDCQAGVCLEEPVSFTDLKNHGRKLVSALGLTDEITQLMRPLDGSESAYLRVRLVDFHHFHRKVRKADASSSIWWRFWPLQPNCFPQNGDLLYMVEESFWKNPVVVVRKEASSFRCIGLVHLWHANEIIKDIKIFKYPMQQSEIQLCDTLVFNEDAEECTFFLHISRICLLAIFDEPWRLESSIDNHRKKYPLQPLCPGDITRDQRHWNTVAFERSMARYIPEWKRIEHRRQSDDDKEMKKIRAECFPGITTDDSLWSYSYTL